VLYIADAYKGLLSLTPDGTLATLSNEVDGTPILYADDLDIAENGIIYFSDASTKFGAEEHGSTLAASLLEIMESKGTGRVLAYNPRTAGKPGMRKLAMRLPEAMRPTTIPYVNILQLDEDGKVLRSFQDPSGAYHEATGAIVHDGQLYITSLHEPDLARRSYPPLK